MTTDGKNLYGINSSGNIYSCPVPCAQSQWQQINGSLKTIDASDPTYISGVNSAGIKYRCVKPCADSNWQQI